MRTSVAIVGAGPAGLFLSQILHRAGIDCVVLERRSRDYVESRVRAGVLEQGTVRLLEEVGVDERMRREGLPHDGFNVAVDGKIFRVDMNRLTNGSNVMVYGQTEITRDLIEAALKRGTALVFEAEDVDPLRCRDRRALRHLHEGRRHPSHRLRLHRRLRRLSRDLPPGDPGGAAAEL